MSYSVDWEPEAEELLLRLPPDLVSQILDGVERLAAAPTERSTRGGPPFYGVDQWYNFEAAHYLITLFFIYSQDETTLIITDLSVRNF